MKTEQSTVSELWVCVFLLYNIMSVCNKPVSDASAGLPNIIVFMGLAAYIFTKEKPPRHIDIHRLMVNYFTGLW